MSDDSLATPVNKLPSVSTRDQTKPTGGEVSYADILKQQEMERQQFDDMAAPQQYPPVQPQFQNGPPPQAETPYAPQQYMPPPQLEPLQAPPPPQYYMPPPALGDPAAGSAPSPEKPKWWKTWILHNKTGWIVALVLFLILTFVYPKIRGMARFAGLPLPYWATGGMAVVGAGMVTAIDISV